MATREQLEEGIRRAHAAGNADHVRQLGNALKAMDAPAAPSGLVDRVRAGTQGAIEAGLPKTPAVQTGTAQVDPFQRSRRLNAAMLSGFSAGAGDELAGAVKGGLDYVFSGFDSDAAARGYEEARDSVRRDREGFAEDVGPVLSTAVELGTGLGAAGPAIGAAVSGARNFGSRLLAGAAAGGVYGSAAGFAEGEGGFGNRLASAGIGGTAGLVVGGSAEAIATGFARAWRSRLAQNAPPPVLVDPTGQPTQEAADLARVAGLDVAQIDPGVLQRLDNVARRGGAPGVPGTEAMLQAELLPVGVPIRLGQATDDFEQQSREYALKRGGGAAAGIMREGDREAETALAANIPALQERIAGGAPLVERGQGGARAQERLISLEATRRAEANRLYEEARALDRAGEDSRVPFAPIDDADDAFNRADPNVEPDLRRAENDVRLARGQQDGTRKAIIRRIQELGGIRTLDPRGNPLSEAGDLAAIFDKRYPPGLVNNKGGRDLDKIREALGEEGWFGNRDPQQVSTADLLEMISNRSGHPDSVRGDWRLQREQGTVKGELESLGVKRRTPEDEAAARLAMSRLEPEEAAAGVETGGLNPRNVDDIREGFDAVDDAPFLDDSRSAATGFGGEEAARVLGGVYSMLRDDAHVLRTLPRVASEMRSLTSAVGEKGALPVGRVFESLKNFAKIQRENAGDEQAVAAGKIKRALERELDAGLEQGLLSGDEGVIDAYRRARSNYREFADTFKRNDMVGALVARDPKRGFELKHSPEEASNFIFNTSDLGLVTKKNLVRDVRRMRDILGPDSEEWNAIRQEAFLRIASKSLGENTPTGRAFSGAKLATAWEDFRRRNRELAAEMFNEAERRDIGNWVETARRVTVDERSLRAPSTSADQMKRLLSRQVQQRIPVLGKFAEFFHSILDTRAARNAVGGRLVRPETRMRAPDTRRAGREIPASIIAGSTLLGPSVGAQ